MGRTPSSARDPPVALLAPGTVTETNVFAPHRGTTMGFVGGVSQAQTKEATMSQNMFPEGWDEERVRRVLASYDKQTEDEAAAEDEAGVASGDTVMNVPYDLVPIVRELIAKHRG